MHWIHDSHLCVDVRDSMYNLSSNALLNSQTILKGYKIRYDSVKAAPLIPKSFLMCAQSPKVLCSLRYNVCP